MPLYPVINKKTKETKTLHISIEKYEEWRNENPDWDKDWSKGCAGTRRSMGWNADNYNIDAICGGGNYEDKNNSLHNPNDVVQEPTVTNDHVRGKIAGFN